MKQLFLQARELGEAERVLFLTKACGGDDELLRDVRQLLSHDRKDTILADSGILPVPNPNSAASHKASSTPSRPDARSQADVTTNHISSDTPVGGRQEMAKAPVVSTSRFGAWSRATRLVALGWFAGLAVVAIVVGWAYHSAINTILQYRAAALRSQCDLAVHSVKTLLDRDLELATQFGVNADLAALAENAGDPENPPPPQRALELAAPEFCDMLHRFWGEQVHCVIWNREQTKVLATSNNLASLGSPSTETGASLLNRVLKGDSLVFLPNNLEMISEGYRPKPGQRTLSLLAPIRASVDAKPSGVCLIRNDAVEERFNALFEQAQTLKTGHLFAFSLDGRMISRPRFAEQLQQLGLIEPSPDVPSTSIVWLRDPGGDLTTGFQTDVPRHSQPLIELVRRSCVEEAGVNVQGYRDLRGHTVIGAWRLVGRHGFGVGVEVDPHELAASAKLMSTLFGLLGGMTLLAAGGLIANRAVTQRLARKEMADQSRVGPYVLEKQIGEGGMGVVYRARHDLLKRLTAVKILKPSVANPATIRRFMREASFACQLSHPNTVNVYDYGSTDDGRFFYTMEYLDGLSLHQLVAMFGPMPAPRAAYLMRQMCGSLREAHAAGFVHRDVKPQNVMVCCCGGEVDFVKVVDFGLVKSADPLMNGPDTTQGEWAGTPRYMAPERLLQPTSVDPRSDVYSAGATLYWMLAGHDAFDGPGLNGLLSAIVTEPPAEFPAEFAVPEPMRLIVAKCLAKSPAERYQSMDALAAAIDALSFALPWTPAAAREWWGRHLPDFLTPRSTNRTASSSDSWNAAASPVASATASH